MKRTPEKIAADIAKAEDDIRVLLELSPWPRRDQAEWDAEMRKLQARRDKLLAERDGR